MKFAYLTVLAFASTVFGQVTIHNGLDINKCLDLTANLLIPGNRMVIFGCNGSGAQRWWVDQATTSVRYSDNRNWCLDTGRKPRVGTPVLINRCNPRSPWQKFAYVLARQHIELISTGLCISVPNDNPADLTILRLERCLNDDRGQVWRPVLEDLSRDLSKDLGKE